MATELAVSFFVGSTVWPTFSTSVFLPIFRTRRAREGIFFFLRGVGSRLGWGAQCYLFSRAYAKKQEARNKVNNKGLDSCFVC